MLDELLFYKRGLGFSSGTRIVADQLPLIELADLFPAPAIIRFGKFRPIFSH